MTHINTKDIQKGDKIEVRWDHNGTLNTRIGVAHHQTDRDKTCWYTKEGGSLGNNNGRAVIILLKRLTKEERLQKRREELLVEFLGEHVAWHYVAPAMCKAIERIIEMEEAK